MVTLLLYVDSTFYIVEQQTNQPSVWLSNKQAGGQGQLTVCISNNVVHTILNNQAESDLKKPSRCL